MKTLTCLLSVLILSATVYGQNAKKSYHTGEDFFKAGNYNDAITQFTNAISINPDYKDAYYMRAITYEQIKEYQKAVDDLNRAVIFEPKNEEIYYHLGANYYELGKFSTALENLNKATYFNRKYLPAYQQKILALIAMDQAFNAVKVCDSALSLESSAYNYFLQGTVNDKLNSQQQAIECYTKAIKADKKFVSAYTAMAFLQLNQGKLDDAMNTCNDALHYDPTSKDAIVTRSMVFLKKMDFSNAINDISRAIVSNPNDDQLFYTRGTYYQQFSQHQNAINDFNKVLSLNPKNINALLKRATSFEEISDPKSAIKDYRQIEQIAGEDEDSKLLIRTAQKRLFELNRESNSPVIVLQSPISLDCKGIDVPNNMKTLKLQGYATDESDLLYLRINGKETEYKNVDGKFTFSTVIPLDTASSITLNASDVYNNIGTLHYHIHRTETDPPKVSLLAPVSSDNGEIFIDNNEPSLYIEGRIADESLIKSVVIEGVTASFRINDMNPTFTATIDINNKSSFTILATDIYGNTKETVYKLNRINSPNASNPMGKTWVIFIENSNYHTFASLEGPTKDVSLMKAALAKYQINNIIHRKDMSKEQMEKFFSIELRDLIRSNHVNTLLIWYAGHGKFINETGYWIPIDANRDDEYTYFNINFLKTSLLSYTNLLTHTLVISDACESGPTFFQAMRSAIRERSCDDWQATRLKSSQVFSSAGYELAQDNSQFTKTFANLLASNPNTCIPIESIVLKVSSTFAQSNKQKPRFGKISGLSDEDGTFFFIAK